ncbi:MAG TPA: hypothetical protein VF086_22330 [Propionibacteriaceae bacterium]
MISRQQAAERVQKAYREWSAKDTRKGRASGAWLVRMIGGGGGI